MEDWKCVVVGDGAVGKTCLLFAMANGTFPDNYIPTVFDNHSTILERSGKQISLNLWDTAGQEDYDRLRPLSYEDTDVILICFTVTDSCTLANVLEKWDPEVSHYIQGVPKILVGLQCDLRNIPQRDKKEVTKEEAEKVAGDIGAECYMECSAKQQIGVKELLDKLLAPVHKPKKNKRRWKISNIAKIFRGKSDKRKEGRKKNPNLYTEETKEQQQEQNGTETSPSDVPEVETSESRENSSETCGGTDIKVIDHEEISLQDMVGRGGFGAVFKGKWEGGGKGEIFAIKKCTIGGTERDVRVPREVDILCSVSCHVNIISFFGVAFNYPDMFIVTEFAEKGSLYNYIYKDKFVPSLDQSLTWALQVARGMGHLHKHDIIHRDLKSPNVLLSDSMEIKLCDFGTARYLEHTTVQTGEAGTYRWMAPEIMEGIDAKISKKCDLFSFAMVAYELLARRLPYHDIPGDPYVAMKVVQGVRPEIPDFVPVYLTALLKECWDADPQKRPSFTYVVELLEQYV